MKRAFTIILIWTAIAILSCRATERETLLNDGWRFHLVNDETSSMQVNKIPSELWEDVTLPHDWSVMQSFDRNATPGNDGGYLPGGIGWYKKSLFLKNLPKGRKLKLYFEGIYQNSEVFVNGQHAGGHPYGYTSFFVDITPYLKKGNNDIAVKVDNSEQKNCRWYSGSGIYRNVRLINTPDVRLADHGTFIKTPNLNTAEISVTAENFSNEIKKLTITAEIEGIAKSEEFTLEAGSKSTTNITLQIPDAKPWSTSNPQLYTANIKLSENGNELDRVKERFGFRTIYWNSKEGFSLNGEPTLLNGGCVHHDNGILGAAAFNKAEYRKAKLMKEAGFNAVRTSHNPPSEAFLEACDELGLLVIDEAFDGWRDEKNKKDYHLLFDKWAAIDVAAMVTRDRNHPSVICWSIGNEIIERKKPQAVKDAHMLATVCKQNDPTRPVTQALASWDSDWVIYDPLAAEHDIVGYNYMIHKAESDHERVPERVIMQTESYPADAWKNYTMTKYHPYVIGDFVWTAIDYLGESGIGRWYYERDVEGEHYHRPLYPWHAAYCGDIDLTGLRKPISHYRSMLWNDDAEQLYIAVKEPDGYNGKIKTTLWGTWPTFESWNWPGHEGKPIDVEIYSRYPIVRLYKDGILVGEKGTEEMKAVFKVDYTPGTLTAEGVNGDKTIERIELNSAGEVTDIKITADQNRISGNGQDLTFITIECIDSNSIVNPTADNLLTVDTKGPIELIGLGNGDIKDEDPYFDNRHKVWKGRALAVIRSKKGSGNGTVTVTATLPNGKTIKKTLNLKIESQN